MKYRIFLLTSALFLLSGAVSAQRFALGIKGGANMGKITGESFKSQYKLGYQFGGFATIPLGDVLAIQPEVIFNQTNSDTSSRFADIYDLGNVKNIELNQLLIPILLNINLNRLITLQVGPQFGITINQDKNIIENGKDAFKTGNFSAAAGVQLNLMQFRIYGRVAGGVTDMNNIDNKDSWKVQNVQLGIGLSIF